MTSQAGSSAEPEPDGPQRIVLTIAGFDPSSGAGITADLKVFAAHSLYGVAAATALTVQSTAGVRRVEPVAPALLSETLACLVADLPLAGIKIGMLANRANVEVVADFLESLQAGARLLPVVLDPVLRSSSGHALLDAAGTERLIARLLPRVSCVTPNVEELYLLAGSGTRQQEGQPQESEQALIVDAAGRLARQCPGIGIVATGGHLAEPHDYVQAPGLIPAWIKGEWVKTPATHGTGCAYSSALLCSLVDGEGLLEAARAAKRYVADALRAARPMGKGGGSMHHLFRLGACTDHAAATRREKVKETGAGREKISTPEEEILPTLPAPRKGIF